MDRVEASKLLIGLPQRASNPCSADALPQTMLSAAVLGGDLRATSIHASRPRELH